MFFSNNKIDNKTCRKIPVVCPPCDVVDGFIPRL